MEFGISKLEFLATLKVCAIPLTVIASPSLEGRGNLSDCFDSCLILVISDISHDVREALDPGAVGYIGEVVVAVDEYRLHTDALSADYI